MKGLAEKANMGAGHRSTASPRLGPADSLPTLLLGKTSVMRPPETERKAEPAKPVRNRNIRWTAMLLATMWSGWPPPWAHRGLTECYGKVEDWAGVSCLCGVYVL
jgi:hypothetical protein